MIRRLLRGGVSRILVGSLIGQGVLLAVSPLLTRIYSPYDFAALMVFTSLCVFIGGLISLSWDRAIVIPRSDVQASAILAWGFLSVTGIGALLAIASYFFGPSVDAVFETRVFGPLWWLLPLTCVLMGVYSLVSSWLVRTKRYGKLATRNATLGIAQAVSSVGLGLLVPGPIGLLTGNAIGRAAAVIGVGGWATLREAGRNSWARMVAVGRRYRRFPLVATWSRALNILGLQLPALLIVALYGTWEAGLYALTVRVLAGPVGVVVDAVSQYFEATFAGHRRDGTGDLTQLIRSITTRLFVIVIVPTVLILAFAPGLFAWLFGGEWRMAGVYAQITVLLFATQFVIAPISRALLVLERQYLQLGWDLARAVLTVLAVTVPFAFGGGLTDALMALTAVQVALYLVMLALCYRAAIDADRRRWRV